MNTKHAEYATAAERLTGETRSAIDRLRTDMADLKTDMAQRDVNMAQRDVEAGKRENRLMLVILGGIAVATAVLGALIAGIPAA